MCEGVCVCVCVCVLIVSYQGHRAALPRAQTITEPCITSQLWTPGRERERDRAEERERERERQKQRHPSYCLSIAGCCFSFFLTVAIFPPTHEFRRLTCWLNKRLQVCLNWLQRPCFLLIPVTFCLSVSLREEAISTFSTSNRSFEMLHILQILRPWNQHQNSFLSTDPTAALELFTSTNMTVGRDL